MNEAIQYRVIRIRNRLGEDHLLGFLPEKEEIVRLSEDGVDRRLIRGLQIAGQHLREVANWPFTGVRPA
jgi:hypothetical protein